MEGSAAPSEAQGKLYGAGVCAFADPALTGWANLWRASGAGPRSTA
jgi:hypothetical protein